MREGHDGPRIGSLYQHSRNNKEEIWTKKKRQQLKHQGTAQSSGELCSPCGTTGSLRKADYWDDLINGRCVEGSLWEAINIVGDHLDNAIADGLLDESD